MSWTAFLGVCSELEVLGALDRLHSLGLATLAAEANNSWALKKTRNRRKVATCLNNVQSDSHGSFDAVLRSILYCSKNSKICTRTHTKIIQDACMTQKNRKSKKDLCGPHVAHLSASVHHRPCTWCTQTWGQSSWWSWPVFKQSHETWYEATGSPSWRQEFHFFTDSSTSQGKLFAFLWNTGLVWPPKPACTRQRVTFCNSKKPKQEVSQQTAVKANERNVMSVFQTFQTAS